MRVVVQRVSRASVTVDGVVVSSIGTGLLLLVGVAGGDTEADARAAAAKIAGLRIFADDEGRMNRSAAEVGGSALVVSQFTLLGDPRRGRRPSFTAAASPESAAPLVSLVADTLAKHGVPAEEGRFGAKMEVELVNDGPVTLVVEVANGSVV
jgi:D-aminoacyl-tRNA deacylase